MNHNFLFFQNQKIRLINPEISNTQVHKCTSNHGWGFRATCTLEMCYRSIIPHMIDIVNPSIPSKPRRCVRFG